MFYSFIIACILLVLSGCGQTYQSYRYQVDQFPSSNKSIVIAHIYPGDTEFDFIKIAQPDGSYYPIDDGKYYTTMYRFKQTTFWPFNQSGSVKVMMVDPGYYAISNIKYMVGNVVYYSDSHLLHSIDGKGFSPTWGAFYAPPGKVVYIGHLNIQYSWREQTFLFKHAYHDEYIEGMLQVKYPGLADMLERGPFFPGGTEQLFHSK